MPYCAAFGCSSKAKAGSGVSFFSFHKDPRICRIWMTRISRKNCRLSQHPKLCSKHFDPDQYERDPAKLAQYGYHKALPRLKQNAVPTVFPHKAEKTTVQRSRAAVEKRRNGKVRYASRYMTFLLLFQVNTVGQSLCGEITHLQSCCFRKPYP